MHIQFNKDYLTNKYNFSMSCGDPLYHIEKYNITNDLLAYDWEIIEEDKPIQGLYKNQPLPYGKTPLDCLVDKLNEVIV